jgi:hypothetical protein
MALFSNPSMRDPWLGGELEMAIREEELTQKPRTLRVKVVDKSKQGDPVVNVTMPIRVVKFGVRMAKSFAPQIKDVDVDWDAITEMIDDGVVGKIVDVEDEAAHKTVEVWIE